MKGTKKILRKEQGKKQEKLKPKEGDGP